MGELNKQLTNQIQIDKAAVQRLLDAAKILRSVTSQEDIERIKQKIGLPNPRLQTEGREILDVGIRKA